MYSTILAIHIVCGFSALISAFIAIFTQVFNKSMNVHRISGKIFVAGMSGVFLTTLPLVYLRPNIFLLLIGIFSFYLAFMGWRMATNRSGIAGVPENTAMISMILAGFVMIIWGAFLLYNTKGQGIILLVFGGIGFTLASTALRRFRKGPIKGQERISSHLGLMMGGTIAAITAFVVTNFQMQPGWILWTAPTILITPIIIWMTRRIKKGNIL